MEKPVRHALTENGNPLPQLLVHGSSWSVTLRRAE
ncbi:hypothetical protein J2853_008952 [Streptosporangium lutulentum]|uniref:Uncharacterized protein n=1 Tax=Streptosporangium lutulentum TaxID=1461250 RepID=A0ABT9QTM0_9ACTN|nr:hypothetical protein [Streptosporangium lutulentum]